MDFREELIKLIVKETNFSNSEIDSLLTIPPQGLGDFALPCFIISKKNKKNPIIVAEELSKIITADFLEKVVANGAYINFFVSKSILSTIVLENIFSNKHNFGSNQGTVMVEYSSPNTNKPLHLGHLRNNALGLAISNLLEFTGHQVIKANLINDRGIHICKSMLAYKLFGDNKNPQSEGMKSDHFVGSMYVLFDKMNKEKPELKLEELAQKMLVDWENEDNETILLWKKMNSWAISGMNETYAEFGTTFDKTFLESEMFGKGNMTELLKEGFDKGVFKKEDNGAITAILEDEGLPNKIIVRGDGTSLYATNDLLLTQLKFDEFKLDKNMWVVANEQDLYFKQLFKIFEKLGREWAKKCYHLSYGYVSLTSGRMKSREGTVVDADNLIKDLKEIALTEINSRYDNLSDIEKDSRAKLIALSAIKFFLLKNDAKKDMVFNPQESISFEGETGPYLQYTFARAKSILRKASKEKIICTHTNFDLLVNYKEKELLLELQKFDENVIKSFEQLSLHSLAHNLLAIAEKFNSYYHDVPILKSDSKELLNARLSLVEATTIVLEKGFKILDIVAIEEM